LGCKGIDYFYFTKSFSLFLNFLTPSCLFIFKELSLFLKAGRKDRQLLFAAKYILKILLLFLWRSLPDKAFNENIFKESHILI